MNREMDLGRLMQKIGRRIEDVSHPLTRMEG